MVWMPSTTQHQGKAREGPWGGANRIAELRLASEAPGKKWSMGLNPEVWLWQQERLAAELRAWCFGGWRKARISSFASAYGGQFGCLDLWILSCLLGCCRHHVLWFRGLRARLFGSYRWDHEPHRKSPQVGRRWVMAVMLAGAALCISPAEVTTCCLPVTIVVLSCLDEVVRLIF